MNRTCSDSFIFKDSNGTDLYKIMFIGNEGTTWKYKVEKLDGVGADISNWALEICETAKVMNSSPPVEPNSKDPNNGTGIGNCLNFQNRIGCFESNEPVVKQQVKWETTGGDFEFTLDQCYEIGCVYFGIKAGDECFCGTIQGPICEPCQPEPGRGILFI